MARDPEIQHATPELCDGLRRVERGDDLTDAPALLEELLFIGLLLADHAGGLHLTREGRQFLAAEVDAPAG
jgi:hypothetical protein